MSENAKRFSIVSNESPDPPYPADTRAKGMAFDIDVERLYQSKTWLIAAPDLKPWLLRLWVESWRSIPVGSYDDDDELIAARIMMPEPLFQAHRKTLMRGWVRHSDGLLYHPVITELVVNLVTWRDRERERKRAYREKMSHGTDAGQVGQGQGQVGQDNTSSSSSSSSNQEREAPQPPELHAAASAPSAKTSPAKRFTPPTVEEVAAYCRERRNHIDPQRFVDYYTANGWKVGRTAMKDWKAAMRTWEKNENGASAPQQPRPEPKRL